MYMCFGIWGVFWRELDFEGILIERVASFLHSALKLLQTSQWNDLWYATFQR